MYNKNESCEEVIELPNRSTYISNTSKPTLSSPNVYASDASNIHFIAIINDIAEMKEFNAAIVRFKYTFVY